MPELAAREHAACQAEQRRLHDTGARIAATLADLDDPEQLHRARMRAESVAEDFARAGEYVDAAYAFWLLASLHGDSSDAVYALESAMEGFALAHAVALRRATGEDLVKLLQRLGRIEEESTVALSLSESN